MSRNSGNGLKSFFLFIGVFLLVILLVVGGGWLALKKWLDGGNSLPIDPSVFHTETAEGNREETLPSPESTATAPEETAPVQSETAFRDKAVTESDLHTGDLILVSPVYEYVFPEKTGVVSLYGKRSVSYQLSSSNISLAQRVINALNAWMDAFTSQGGPDDVIVTGGYRSYEEQQEKFDAYVEKHGADQNALARPGTSDHHTGLGVDLKVYADGIMYSLNEKEEFAWVSENAWRFGFVERYPAGKSDVTGISYTDSKYFRFVGTPHAEIMKKNGYTLEEYVMFLRDYPFDGTHYLFTAEDGSVYEIYHVLYTGTPIMVPAEKEYSLSGDNIDGFFVTFKH